MLGSFGGVGGTNFAKTRRTMAASGLNQNGQRINYNVTNTSRGPGGNWQYNTPPAVHQGQSQTFGRSGGGRAPFDPNGQSTGVDGMPASYPSSTPYGGVPSNYPSGGTTIPTQTPQGYPINSATGPTVRGPYSASNPNGWMADQSTTGMGGGVQGLGNGRGYAAIDENGQGVGTGYDVNEVGNNAPPPSTGGWTPPGQAGQGVSGQGAQQYQNGIISANMQKWLTENPGRDISEYWRLESQIPGGTPDVPVVSPQGYPINSFGGGNPNPWNNPQSDPRLRGGQTGPYVRM